MCPRHAIRPTEALPEHVRQLGYQVLLILELAIPPGLAAHGPTLFAGLSKHVDSKLVSLLELESGAVALRHEPRR